MDTYLLLETQTACNNRLSEIQMTFAFLVAPILRLMFVSSASSELQRCVGAITWMRSSNSL